MCFRNIEVSGGNKIKIMQNILRPTFLRRPTPSGILCNGSVSNL